MRFKYNFLLLIVVFLYCSSESYVDTVPPETVLTDVLALELTVGDDEQAKDYVLAGGAQMRIAVNDEDDIYVVDDDKIKIFDKNGNGKMILGGRGNEPGEFYRAGFPTIAPTGYLTVLDTHIDAPFNLYDPYNNFVMRKNFRTSEAREKLIAVHELRAINLEKVVSIDENETIMEGAGLPLSREDIPGRYNILFYENPDTLITLAKYGVMNYVTGGGLGSYIPDLGDFYWDISADREIIYTHTWYDRESNKDRQHYILHIFSLDTFEKTCIVHAYKPVKFQISGEGIAQIRDQRIRDFETAKIEAAGKAEYYAPLQLILVDDTFVFAFTYEQNSAGEFLVDIFDTKTAVFLRSAYFSFRTELIENGYAYNIINAPDTSPKIEKYRIDPAVYGR
ncbi:hypothetical protein AMJ80_05625 [bacterium SM23_31]|nr:MAG: hypothetical protein AMJ80_05625 [bacterium SM23_31]